MILSLAFFKVLPWNQIGLIEMKEIFTKIQFDLNFKACSRLTHFLYEEYILRLVEKWNIHFIEIS